MSVEADKIKKKTEIFGSLHQDCHSGIMGVLGLESPMIPVTVKVLSLGEKSEFRGEKDFHFFVFSSRRRHTRLQGDWSSDVCSSDLPDGSSVLRRCVLEPESGQEPQ